MNLDDPANHLNIEENARLAHCGRIAGNPEVATNGHAGLQRPRPKGRITH